MSITLQNEFLKIEAVEKGAELISIKTVKDEAEYLWTGKSDIWARHAPILFPIVGKVKNNTYRINDNTYNLSQHGFARDMSFEAIKNTDSTAMFKLSYNEETLSKYPYKFELMVKYELKDNEIEVSYTVRNVDDKEIYFSIGAHPGFNCPVIGGDTENEDLKFEDYYFEFEKRETTNIIPIDENGLLKESPTPFLYDSNIIHLKRELFKKDAIIFKELSSKKVSLKNIKNSRAVTLEFDGFPYLGLWSKPQGAPFVCIEPWFGHADFEDFNGDFREKDGVMKLLRKQEFNCRYTIKIFE
ncbi:aldose 1-epimerase family protein [Clostridium neuense]|uniref:Aldose 1-epimerase family protein n=1 Tax=Clostridium neuense TaxID=1728934 RepID=A0ABW8T9T8_9CLOT